MTYLFTRANEELLQMFAWSNVLLAFDYDGTLAPLTATPSRARMRSSTERLLKRVVTLYPCVVISGRGRHDALRRLKGIEIHRVVGNHGAEPHGSQALRRRVRQWLPVLNSHLSHRQGVIIEDKGLSVSVHYRRARRRSAARQAILAAAQALHDARIIGGKLVFNFVVQDAPHKGLALERECAHFACDTVIYVGDDETDEDVFALDRPGWLLAVRVGRKRNSAAPYYLSNQKEIDRLLSVLSWLRGGRHD